MAHTSATRAVKQERERLTKIVEADVDDGRAIVEVQESLRQGTARISAIDTELADVDGANEELARALASISPHIEGENCPVCGRDFSEISSQPLAAHVSEEVARLVAAAGRLQALVRDRSATASAVAEVQRREAEIAARRLSQSRRDELKVELARLAEWSNSLDSLAEAARAGTALQRKVAQAAQRLAELNSLNLAVIGLRAEIGQYAADLGMPLPEADAALESTVGSLLAEVDRQERLEAESKTRRLHAIETLEQVARLHAQLGAAVTTLGDANARLDRLRFCKAEAERRIEVARELARRARALRTAKVREVFNDELNSVWQDLFIRLAPDERFVPAFALPETTTGQVEAILETHYRSGGKGGNPRAMLSTGNLNTAALTLWLALHLSVRPVLPWLVLDDPVQSMDDVHIAQLAALLRTLKQTRRQVIIAVHDRQLFEYLALELSPAFNGDRLITIELGRGADGRTTAPWDLKTYEPDRAIAA
jgi:DNA repair protein SbcC/Rad50